MESKPNVSLESVKIKPNVSLESVKIKPHVSLNIVNSNPDVNKGINNYKCKHCDKIYKHKQSKQDNFYW